MKIRLSFELYNFAELILERHENLNYSIEFFFDFKTRREFLNESDWLIFSISLSHNDWLTKTWSCSFQNETEHQVTLFICIVRKRLIFALDAETSCWRCELMSCDHLWSRRDCWHKRNHSLKYSTSRETIDWLLFECFHWCFRWLTTRKKWSSFSSILISSHVKKIFRHRFHSRHSSSINEIYSRKHSKERFAERREESNWIFNMNYRINSHEKRRDLDISFNLSF